MTTPKIEFTPSAQLEAANAVSSLIETFLLHLQESGLPPSAILSGAHSQIVAMMTAALGGPMAAHLCSQAAERVKHLPSHQAAALALAPPLGRA